MIVLEPAQQFDTTTDRVFTVGKVVEDDSSRFAVNGRSSPEPIVLRYGTSYRFRFINILAAAAIGVDLVSDTTHHTWKTISKDGADLPPSARITRPASLRRFGVGETHDVEYTASRRGNATLVFLIENTTIRQPVRIE
jgi:hypothetical protein